MPVGAFGGRADIMKMLSPLGPVYQAGTLSGNPVAMTAGLATLKKLDNPDVYRQLEERNRRFVTVLTSRLESCVVSMAGVASIFWITFQRELPRAAHHIDTDGIAHFNRMHSRALEEGIYLPPSGYEVCFISTTHTDEVLDQAADILSRLIADEAHVWV